MRPGEREVGSIVVKRCGLPGFRGVANAAIVAKVTRYMVGIGGILEIFAMATVAIPGQATYLVILMTTGTLCPPMGPFQGKSTTLQVVKPRIVPGNLVVA